MEQSTKITEETQKGKFQKICKMLGNDTTKLKVEKTCPKQLEINKHFTENSGGDKKMVKQTNKIVGNITDTLAKTREKRKATEISNIASRFTSRKATRPSRKHNL